MNLPAVPTTANGDPTVPDKPALPTTLGEDWQRIPVDDADGGHFQRLVQMAMFAADHWTFGPDGPYGNRPLTRAETTREQFQQGFLHLLELGFVDIDAARMDAAEFWPMNRSGA